MPTYAITGASGQLGRLAVHELLARGVPASDVVAVVRTPSRAADLVEFGVQVREGDYSRPQTLGAALAGVDRVLLVSSSQAGRRVVHHTNVIEAAKSAGTARTLPELNRSSQQCVGDWMVKDTETRLSSWRRERSECRSGDSRVRVFVGLMPRCPGSC